MHARPHSWIEKLSRQSVVATRLSLLSERPKLYFLFHNQKPKAKSQKSKVKSQKSKITLDLRDFSPIICSVSNI
jgi:hypothetical protein